MNPLGFIQSSSQLVGFKHCLQAAGDKFQQSYGLTECFSSGQAIQSGLAGSRLFGPPGVRRIPRFGQVGQRFRSRSGRPPHCGLRFRSLDHQAQGAASGGADAHQAILSPTSAREHMAVGLLPRGNLPDAFGADRATLRFRDVPRAQSFRLGTPWHRTGSMTELEFQTGELFEMSRDVLRKRVAQTIREVFQTAERSRWQRGDRVGRRRPNACSRFVRIFHSPRPAGFWSIAHPLILSFCWSVHGEGRNSHCLHFQWAS